MFVSKVRMSLLVKIVTITVVITSVNNMILTEDDTEDTTRQERQFPILVATGLNLNNTLTLAALACLACLTGLLPILSIGGLFLGLLLSQKSYYPTHPTHSAHPTHSGHPTHSYNGYRSLGMDVGNYARAFGLDFGNWESYSLTDWMSIGQETLMKFDPSDFECHKKVICELHQNQENFGSIGSKVVHAFSYLEYARIFGLPESLLSYADEYLEAAAIGRTISKDCGLIYPTCNFSIKSIVDRFSPPSTNDL